VSQIFENGGLLTNSLVPKLLILVFDAPRIPPRRAGACNTLKEPAEEIRGRLPTPRAAWVHQIHAAAGVGGSTTMVMVFVR